MYDWGRIVHISYTFMLLSYFFLLKKNCINIDKEKLQKNIFTKNYNKKIKIKSIAVEHGNVKSNCFIIDRKLAYISDVSKIYNRDFKDFKNLNYLVIDCLWYNYHPSHFNLEKSLFSSSF